MASLSQPQPTPSFWIFPNLPAHNSPLWRAWTAGCSHGSPAPGTPRTPQWSSAQTESEGPPSWTPRWTRRGGTGWLGRTWRGRQVSAIIELVSTESLAWVTAEACHDLRPLVLMVLSVNSEATVVFHVCYLIQKLWFAHFLVEGTRLSPKTLLRGSLMLTVWSWEAERELLMERSPVTSMQCQLQRKQGELTALAF